MKRYFLIILFTIFFIPNVSAKTYSWRVENYTYSTTTGVCNNSQTFAYSTNFGVDANFKTGKMGYGSANISGQMSALSFSVLWQLEKSTKYTITIANPNGWLLSNFDYIAVSLQNGTNSSCGNIVRRITNITKAVNGMYLNITFTTTNDTFNSFGLEIDNLTSGKYLTPTPNFRLNPYVLLVNEDIKTDSDNTDKVIDNQNKNSQDIIDNQNKNSDEIKDTINDNLQSCRKSKNLLSYSNIDNTLNGVRVVGNNGVYKFSGTWTGSANGPTFDIPPVTLIPGNYTLSLNRLGSSIYPYVILKSNGNQVVRVNTGLLAHFTLTEPTTINQIQFYYNSATYNSEYSLMLNEGNTALNFEEYNKDICSNKLDDINDTLTDDNINSSKDNANSFFNNFNDNDHGLSSIITTPLNTIKSLTSKTCSPLNIPLPFVNKNISLPCMTTIYENHFGAFYDLYKIISFGIISYLCCIDIYKIVKGFKDPNSDKIEVVDL